MGRARTKDGGDHCLQRQVHPMRECSEAIRRLVEIGPRRAKAMKVLEPTKETKTAEELAAMIREDLSNVDGCPERGVSVTVYGIPWRAMLMFGAAAGPVRNKAELQKFFEIITERLQRLYAVAQGQAAIVPYHKDHRGSFRAYLLQLPPIRCCLSHNQSQTTEAPRKANVPRNF
jgi:hypothetical protein